jgi:hypothetical protein
MKHKEKSMRDLAGGLKIRVGKLNSRTRLAGSRATAKSEIHERGPSPAEREYQHRSGRQQETNSTAAKIDPCRDEKVDLRCGRKTKARKMKSDKNRAAAARPRRVDPCLTAAVPEAKWGK